MTASGPLLADFFIEYATKAPVFFVSVVFTVVVSVTLHELGHAYAADWQGDPTPRLAGHMTLNPLVHMGGTSLVFLFLAGLAWGLTPVDPTRFRSKFGEAFVSFAGPAVNLLLAVLGLTAWVLWGHAVGHDPTPLQKNLVVFLYYFGTTNVVLLLFNMIPVPPLDGSTVLADFFRPFRKVIRDPNNHGIFWAAFIGIFFLAQYLFEAADAVAVFWLRLLGG